MKRGDVWLQLWPRGANPGVIGGNGEVIVWRLGGPVVLGRVPNQYRYRAYETPTGIAVATSPGSGVLEPWNGCPPTSVPT
ncbi:hypothetical protein CF165_38355 [Amycolatopsis vastitatis]|uniref:Uncharacterized protein n=1 Tax=Amycolatopsis vastitatis TaxID=1905142 RepID=A0A229SR65_9PSEU|nr:hypothetical protein CF165_38355 [Amycolatopsis vastitatis]